MALTKNDLEQIGQVIHGAMDVVLKQVSELREKFGELREEFGELREEFGGLRGEFGDLREEVGGIKKEMYSLKQRMDDQVITAYDNHQAQMTLMGRYVNDVIVSS
ncbi:MAG: hypothetical protein Q8P95_03240 [bacterium]|nr:hypothetical protein [bacterium]